MFGTNFEYGDPRDRETVGQRRQKKAAAREGSIVTTDSAERATSPQPSGRKTSSSASSVSSASKQPPAPPPTASSQKPKSRFGFFGRSKDTANEKKTSLESELPNPEPKISLSSLDTSIQFPRPNNSYGQPGFYTQPTPPASDNDISRHPPMPPPSFPVPPTPDDGRIRPHNFPMPTQRIATDFSLRPIIDPTAEELTASSPRSGRIASMGSGWTATESSTSGPQSAGPNSQLDGIDQSFRSFYIADHETNYKFQRNARPETKPHPIQTQPPSGIRSSPNSAGLPSYDALGFQPHLEVDTKTAPRAQSRVAEKQLPVAPASRSRFQAALTKMENAGLKIMFKRLSEDWTSSGTDGDNAMLEEVAFEQRLWALVAAEWLTFGKSLQSDAHEDMLHAQVHDGKRMLHLHGSAADGWVLAAKYPNVTVYSVSSQDISNPPCSWPAPLNHHSLFTPQPNSPIPFPDNYFDVVSTKSLPSILRMSDWAPLLKECNRVLKPGGWVELQIIDPVLTKQGDLLRDWLESRILREMMEDNYAIKPSDDVLGFLQETGFDSVKRSRIALPASFNPKLKNVARGQGPDPDAARVMVLVGRHFYEELYRGFNPIINGPGGDYLWWQNKSIRHECEALNTCFGLTFAFGQKI